MLHLFVSSSNDAKQDTQILKCSVMLLHKEPNTDQNQEKFVSSKKKKKKSSTSSVLLLKYLTFWSFKMSCCCRQTATFSRRQIRLMRKKSLRSRLFSPSVRPSPPLRGRLLKYPGPAAPPSVRVQQTMDRPEPERGREARVTMPGSYQLGISK